MAKFNSATKKEKVTNVAGGTGFKQEPEHELIGILLTSFVEDSYYESSGERLMRLRDVMKKCDTEFLAKAAIYARDEFNMRSITHVLAGELAKRLSGSYLGKRFYNKIVVRPDDMSEILSYINKGNNDMKVPNAIKRGFAHAFGRFDSYQLAKYKMNNRDVSLVDLVNLVHPKEHDKNGYIEVDKDTYLKSLSKKRRKEINKQDLGDTVNLHSLEALTLNLLKSENTWESKQASAGKADTEEEKQERKKEGWEELVNNDRLGYMSLLKNLRNILENAPHLSDKVSKLLINRDKIKKSRTLPFRIFSAAKILEGLPQKDEVEEVINALYEAFEIAVDNIPDLGGRTCVFVDVSASMSSPVSNMSHIKRDHIATLFGAALHKKTGAKVIAFGTEGKSISLRKSDSVLTNARKIDNDYDGSRGTSFINAFDEFLKLDQKFDRLIWLTDDQGWYGSEGDNVMRSLSQYEQKNGPVRVYSMQLDSYGTTKFAKNKVLNIPGFSEKIFDFINLMEKDKDAFVKEINKIEL